MRAVAISLTALATVALGLHLFRSRPSPVQTFVSVALQSGWTDERLEPLVQDVVRVLLEAGEFPSGVVINRPIVSDALNIYLVSYAPPARQDARNRFPDFVGTIAYLGQSNAVLIDVDYLESLGERLGFVNNHSGNPYWRVSANREGLQQLLMWVIGHELGHLAANRGPRHFGPSDLDKPSAYDRARYREEVEADEALAARLARSTRAGRLANAALLSFGFNMAALIEAELRRTLGVPREQGPMFHFFDTLNNVPVATGSHPEFFLRAVRLLARLDGPDVTPLAALKDNVGRFEARLQPVTASAGRLTIDGDPLGGVVLIDDRRGSIRRFALPVDTWITPGAYEIRASADTFLSVTRSVVVTEGKATLLALNLVPDAKARAAATDHLGIAPWIAANEHLNAALSQFSSGESNEAAAWELSRARELAPAWSWPVFLEARMAEDGDPLGARRAYQEALELLSKERPWQRSVRDDVRRLADAEIAARRGLGTTEFPDLLIELVEWLWTFDENALAEERLAELERLLPNDPRILLNSARLHFDAGRNRDAERALRSLLARDADSVEARRLLSRVLERTDRDGEAERVLRGIVVAGPQNSDAVAAMADFYWRHDRSREAAETYVRAAKLSPDRGQYWCDAGKAYRQRGDRAAAERAFRAPPESDMEADCLAGLAVLLQERGQSTAAVGLCQRLADSQNDYDRKVGLKCVGDLEIRDRHPQPARAAYAKAAWFYATDAEMYRGLAEADAMSGAADAASMHRWVAEQLELRLAR